MKLLMILITLLLGPLSAAQAQQQCYSPGTFTIGGFPFNCGQAPTCIDPNIGDIGRAAPGQAIWLHPLLNNYPTGVIAFVFAHECSHFQGNMNEQAADAWAIKVGRDQGWINPITVQQLCQSVYFSPGVWPHFPGPERCQMMINAFSTR